MVEELPLLVDAEEAIDYFLRPNLNDAQKSYAVGVMANDGYTNSKIREVTGIKQVYTATHYIRAGTILSMEELSFWHENIAICETKKRISDKYMGRIHHLITLGHIRTLLKLPKDARLALLSQIQNEEEHQGKAISIERLRKLMAGQSLSKENRSDLVRYQNSISEQLGRGVNITYNAKQETGTIKLTYYQLSDLEMIVNAIGYDANKDENY